MKMKMKKCEFCGKEFEDYSWNRKKRFCSESCWKKSYYQKNRERLLNVQKSYQKRYRKSGTECVVCGKPLPFRKHKYCSWECKLKATGRKYERKAGDIVKCAWCGKEFVYKGGSKKFCSKSCKLKNAWNQWGKHGPKHHIGEKTECIKCGVEIIKTTPNQKYCSDCSRHKNYSQSLVGYDDEPNRCQYCGGIIKGNQYVVCEECAKVVKTKFENKRIYKGEVTDRLFPVGDCV